MSKTGTGVYATPITGTGGTPGSYPVFPVHVGIIVARGFQIFFSIVIIGMAGVLMHGHVMSPNVFALVCGFMTWAIALYAILTEKVAGCRAGYNYWAVLSLDLLMIIFWLASLGANAALRASFKYSTNAECYNDGSALDSSYCYTWKRGLEPRAAVANSVGLALMSAIAGLSALQMLLFIASFAYLCHKVRLHLQAEKRGVASGDAGIVEMKVQNPPVMDPYGAPAASAQVPPTASYAYPSQVYHDAAPAVLPQQQQQQQQQQQPYGGFVPQQIVPAAQQAYAPQPAPTQAYPQQVPTPAPQGYPSPISAQTTGSAPPTYPYATQGQPQAQPHFGTASPAQHQQQYYSPQ